MTVTYHLPRIDVVRATCIPTPYSDEYDHHSLQVVTVGRASFVTVTASNETWPSGHCHRLHRLAFLPCDEYDDPEVAAIQRFDQLCLEIRLENHLERETIEFNDVIKLMEESP